MTVTGKVILGLLALGVGTYVVSEAIAARPRRGRIPGTPDAPPPIPPTGDHPTGNYVGTGWTGWPHKDAFPDEDALVQAFLRLGYDVTDDLLSAKSMAEVQRFQADNNLWAILYGDLGLGPELQEYPASPTTGVIDEDRLVGSDTVSAVYDALLADQNFPGGWAAMVLWYEDRA